LRLSQRRRPPRPHTHPQNEERININTASVEELQRLPGVGAALGLRIVEHSR